jgi:uncharacterized protein (DUF1499 family)
MKRESSVGKEAHPSRHQQLCNTFKWATIVSLEAFVVCLLTAVGGLVRRQRAGRWSVYVGVLLSVICAGVPLYHYGKAQRVPAMHDITTDTEHPPPFVALAAARTAAPNGLAYQGTAITVAQRRAYPDIVPSLSPLPPATLVAQAEAVTRALGWEIVAAEPQHGRLEATDTSLLFGFKDDIVIQITPRERGSQLDIRSMSRVGRSDVGVNAQRIRRLLKRLTTATAHTPRSTEPASRRPAWGHG